ncbi:MAG: DUF3160 domain-containing protein [Planctomycetes bacterium]|nr:DUF3160 domain-containing protein [Planctomycetota bacterium]
MVIAPEFPLHPPRMPAIWLAYAAAVAVFAALLFAFAWNVNRGSGGSGQNFAAGNEPANPKSTPDKEPQRDLPKGASVSRFGRTGPDVGFAGAYPKLPDKPQPTLKQYALPLTEDQFGNAENRLVAQVLADAQAKSMLLKNGFVVLPTGNGENVGALLNQISKGGTPVVVTPDCVLQVFHICFDETLKDLEEQVFAWDILDVCNRLLAISDAGYKQAKAAVETPGNPAHVADQQSRLMEAWKLNVAFLAVPCKLLGESPRVRRIETNEDTGEQTFFEEGAQVVTLPDYVQASTTAELALMDKHEGFSPSPVFGYADDYSQYVPRGHYTRTELLKRYFKAMMWLGRATFLAHNVPGAGNVDERGISAQVAITPAMAERMTLAAALIAKEVETTTAGKLPARPAFAQPLPEEYTIKQLWERVYGCTGFFVGVADDLSPSEYFKNLDGNDPNGLADAATLRKFMDGIDALALPRIYGGTGNFAVYKAGEESLTTLLRHGQGMRLMGQRFVPDSNAMGKLVFPNVGKPLAGEQGASSSNLTWVRAEGGEIRAFPRGLDVAALMGSKRARAILTETKDDGYENYDSTLATLKSEWDAMTFADWQRNLYTAWLYTLKPLLEDRDSRKGYPTFMQSQAYEDRLLTTALASWSQLRHDTILYAKQSYTGRFGGGMPPKPVRAVGYVEPVVEFYDRMYALCEMMRLGLNQLNVSSKTANQRLERLSEVVQRLARLSREELANQELAQEDYDFIKGFGNSVNYTLRPEYGELDARTLRTDIIADVHTDGNTKQCLEVGTGKLRLMAVAYYNPDGQLIVGVGPVFSFYEFRHPMSDRLTDEKWQEMLSTGKTPADPEWVKSFTSGK